MTLIRAPLLYPVWDFLVQSGYDTLSAGWEDSGATARPGYATAKPRKGAIDIEPGELPVLVRFRWSQVESRDARRVPREGLVLTSDAKVYPSFTTRRWHKLNTAVKPDLPPKDTVLRWMWTNLDQVRLNLKIAPESRSSSELKALRQKFLDRALAHAEMFKIPAPVQKAGKPNRLTTSLWSRTIITPQSYAAWDPEQREAEIRRFWQEFLKDHFLKLRDALLRKS